MGRTSVVISLCVVLATLWVVLSGRITDGLILSLGAASILTVLILVGRLGILDRETAPQARIVPLLRYWSWLGGEIAKANIAVTRIVLSTAIDLTPRLVRTPAAAKSGLGRATFANSVTLTPGTVTVSVETGELVVHALTASFADAGAFREMDGRATQAVEGRAETKRQPQTPRPAPKGSRS